ncbi:MAG: type II secretion system protein GspG [Roseibacillus sp.]|nr:type II secretion system protein GspG [Roseibacillus sp.]
MTNPPIPQFPIQAPQHFQPRTSGLAIASLVCSLTGVSLLAVIFGHIALGKIRQSNGAVEGRGLALAGTIVGYVGFALSIAMFIAFFIIPLVLVGGAVAAGGAVVTGAVTEMVQNVDQTNEELQSINDALTEYSERAGHFPSEDQGIKALVTEPTTAPLPKNWKASFSTLPLDAWGHEFVYRLPEDPNPEDPLNRPRPEVISMGADGVIGNYDDQSTEELLP